MMTGAGALLLSLQAMAATSTPAGDDAAVMARGAYLATASDCTACHTAPGGKPMAGGLAIASPVGDIIASNITPSTSDGIGDYSEQDFARALRKGVRADGANLYPAMPYTAYAHLSDDDIHALYVYFMKGVTPVNEPTGTTNLPFPMNLRFSMKFWNLLFLKDGVITPDPQHSETWNRGRYLVEGPAHCSTCHTPRGILMQEKGDQWLAGAQVGPWYAPNITPDVTSGIGSWSRQDLVTYLKTGRIDRAQAAGSMAEAIEHSFQHLTDDDLKAMATYLGTLPAIRTGDDGSSAEEDNRFERGSPGSDLSFRGTSYAKGLKGDSEGAQLYAAHCASCHNYDGQGTADGYYPSLYHNAALGGDTASNLLAAILYGVDRETQNGHFFMPPFGDQPNAVTSLDNEQIAALANYLLERYGNPDVSVSSQDVQSIRDGGPASNILMLARVGMAAGGIVLVVVLIAVILHRRRRR
ncbi:c-type cytochrome [Kushneria avicenniae]|nr:cytochrome c [Kushneria avicenniae]